MKNVLKAVGITIALTTIGVAVRAIKDIEELKFKTSSNIGKLSTRPGLSEIDRLDTRINIRKHI